MRYGAANPPQSLADPRPDCTPGRPDEAARLPDAELAKVLDRICVLDRERALQSKEPQALEQSTRKRTDGPVCRASVR